ncbi:MAG: methylated-DNA--[protein]-cysteine S-methyltransferase [Ignavibacteria bacterium]|nr:methylated-DNA--[protein]-cysteine S-methyltransferase [Ignavibacteria bacterium]
MYNSILKTPIGNLLITTNERELLSVEFTSKKKIGTIRKPGILRKTEKQLIKYFSGKQKKFNLKKKYSGTEFQIKVWKALETVPYGKTESYEDIAKKIAAPKAYRAIGNANSRNKISIIIPCHRVITKSGKLGGYGGGVDKKKYLLGFERENGVIKN